MYLSGFADEASSGIDGQIKVTKELGWEYIETRAIDGKNIHDISDEQFDVVYGKLQDAGVKVNCFGAAVANWGKKIDQPYDATIEEIKRAIPRMKRLDTKFIRIMSFAVLEDREPEDQMEEERFKRLREICGMFADEGLEALHENCMNYGGMSWQYTLKLIENVPGLRLIFDTGNPVGSWDRSKAKPYPKQSAWEFYSNVKQYIAHVHIKDGIYYPEKDETVYTFPNEGQAEVGRIVKDMLDNGYDGGFSIEPHMAVMAHDTSITATEDTKYANYLAYGKRMTKLVADIRA